jgi:hypothetical protein
MSRHVDEPGTVTLTTPWGRRTHSCDGEVTYTGGAASVRPDDTIGAEDLCWCGQPQGHDWPGKQQGRKHPREERGMAVQAERRLDRRDLRAYHRALQDFVLTCVNEQHLKFRLAKNSVILFPPDGTQPITVFARSGDRQVRQLQKWFIEHVYREPPDEGPVDEEALARLAEAASTVDHSIREKKKEHAVSTETAESTKQDPVEKEPPVAPRAESEKKKYGAAKAAQESNRKPGAWRPYVTATGVPHPLVVTDGQRVRCTSEVCVGTEHEFLKSKQSIGGHMRIHHSETVKEFYSPATIEKRVDSNKHSRLTGEVIKAMEILGSAVGVQLGGGDVTTLQEKVATLEKDLKAATVERDEFKARIEELEAKQALMREALGL